MGLGQSPPWCWETWDDHVQKNETAHHPMPPTDTDSEWPKDGNLRPAVAEGLDEGTGGELYAVR